MAMKGQVFVGWISIAMMCIIYSWNIFHPLGVVRKSVHDVFILDLYSGFPDSHYGMDDQIP
jgi:hypothetical protein